MAKTKRNFSAIRFAALLALGFLGLCLPNALHFAWGNGLATAVWIFCFLRLADRFCTRREEIITFAVFLVGYLVRWLISVEFAPVYLAVFLPLGLIQYGIFYGYSLLLRRWNRFAATLAFPLAWMAVFLLATAARVPSLIRVDMMFADMKVLLQAESVLGAFGLSFLLLWILSLASYAIGNRMGGPAILGALIYLALLTVGLVCLFPNVSENETVRVAMCTGPYVGDYMDYTSLPVERCAESMRSCVAAAAEQGAEILVFNEETYEMDDSAEAGFLAKCCAAARENNIHVLVGFDLHDTDGSENGKSLNKVIWIDPEGEVLGSYLKTKTIPFLESDYVRGDGVIPSHEITVGDKRLKVSYLICYDSNFPLYVDRIESDTDILFLPSWDWAAVTETHSMLCRTLAVDNRVSIVKPTYDGLSLAVRSDGTVIDSFNCNDTGYEQVRLVDVPLGGERGFTSENPEKDHYIYGIIGVEIFSILVCLLLICGTLFENRERSPRNRMYLIILVTCAAALITDALSWILDGCRRLEPVLYASTVLSILMTFVLDCEYVYYVTEVVREKEPISNKLPRWYMAFSAVICLLILASSGSGLLFRFENGVYHDGPLYTAYVILNLLCVFFCMWANLHRARSLSRHDRLALMSYIVIPVLAAVVNLFNETFSYAYPAIALSMVVLYVMIQSERQTKLAREGSESYYIAHHDALTGLPNRLAYEERLKEFAASGNKVGVLFTDVNGLKLANDSFGHEAGDRLLMRYAGLVTRYFRREEVFRISGDEFTVLAANMTREMLEARTNDLRRTMMVDGSPMASIGLAYGNGEDIGELIKAAEAAMYSEKAEFHNAHPEARRY